VFVLLLASFLLVGKAQLVNNNLCCDTRIVGLIEKVQKPKNLIKDKVLIWILA
jgi:hypothetical protein